MSVPIHASKTCIWRCEQSPGYLFGHKSAILGECGWLEIGDQISFTLASGDRKRLGIKKFMAMDRLPVCFAFTDHCWPVCLRLLVVRSGNMMPSKVAYALLVCAGHPGGPVGADAGRPGRTERAARVGALRGAHSQSNVVRIQYNCQAQQQHLRRAVDAVRPADQDESLEEVEIEEMHPPEKQPPGDDRVYNLANWPCVVPCTRLFALLLRQIYMIHQIQLDNHCFADG